MIGPFEKSGRPPRASDPRVGLGERPTFAPVRTRRAFEEICIQIRREIQLGRVSAGDRLPTERELAQQFGVSRATVREALRALEIGGVVSLHQGAAGGALVQRGTPEPIMRTMQDMLLLGGLSLEDFTEARVCLQAEIIRLACERATESDFSAIADNIARTSAVDLGENPGKRADLSVEFYSLLAAATRNGAMEVLMRAFTEPLSFYIRRIGPDTTWDVAESRAKFLSHLRARDVSAARKEMESHMKRLHRYLISRFEGGCEA
jgi:GntR family transcriptional regulator, transcriptional repressor for pyruvate dehydrogenase complex